MITVRFAASQDTPVIARILAEAEAWVTERGTPMWELGEIEEKRVAQEVADGFFAVAWVDDEIAGTVKFQLRDDEFWPDRPDDNAAYIHRLAVRRKHAGRGVSDALMRWAADRARLLKRDMLRLDVDAERVSLRNVYERFGFVYRDDRQVGPYLVARYELKL